MNPDRIYSQYRDDALAKQATASEYATFVAMPFGDRFSYRSKEIYSNVIQAAALEANALNQTPRKFAGPKRVDDCAGTATVITEAIVTEILYSHLFVGDLTFANPGVLLEVGIAMGLKPNAQIVIITQGDLRDLHFDIRNNNILSYNQKDAVSQLASAMIAGAKSFEADADRFIESITKTLTPDAITTLKAYGALQQRNRSQSLHLGIAEMLFSKDSRAAERFEQASRELLSKRLIHTEYKVQAVPGVDMFGMHATQLGCVVIGRMWPELAKNAN
jgi:hypothetical protein